jgi:hypothetical protein
MACNTLMNKHLHVIVCGPDAFVSLKPYDADVWLEWHNYLGPTFYRSEKALKPIQVPSRKTWAAFNKWKVEFDEKGEHG